MENIAFVLGNGNSRLPLNLEQLKETGTVYGCNAIYREFTPHVLVSTDVGISKEIQDSGFPLSNVHYTRSPIPHSGSKKIEYNYGFSSGPIALTYAAKSTVERIYFAGFDLKGTNDGKINNIYAGTANYKGIEAQETPFSNWVTQIQTVMKTYSAKRFIRIVQPNVYTPDEWKLTNYQEMPMADFLVWINKLNPR